MKKQMKAQTHFLFNLDFRLLRCETLNFFISRPIRETKACGKSQIMIGFMFTSQLNLKFRVYSDKSLEPLESRYVKVMDKMIERFSLEC